MDSIVASITYQISPLTTGVLTLIYVLVACALRRGVLRNLSERTFRVLVGLAGAAVIFLSSQSSLLIGIDAVNVYGIACFGAGLVFGAPAGSISGVVGAALIFVDAATGDYSYVPTAVPALVIEGICADLLSWFIFKDRVPHWVYGTVFGAAGEVLHWMIIVLLNFSYLHEAYHEHDLTVVNATIYLYILTAGVAVGIIVAIANKLLHGQARIAPGARLSEKLNFWLVLCFSGSLAIAAIFAKALHHTMSEVLGDEFNSSEILEEVNRYDLLLEIFFATIVFVVLFLAVAVLIDRLGTRNVVKVNETLEALRSGNLDAEVDVRMTSEFSELSDHINRAVAVMREHIAREAQRIDAELETARTIQASALPPQRMLPQDRPRIDLFAEMNPAREVGGDFYDYYLIDADHVGFCVADVSGKGITAALFMMRSMTLIKTQLQKTGDVASALSVANDELCQGNDADMFVTCWLGVLDLVSGQLTFANAGHNPPILKAPDGTCHFIESRPNMVLAAFEGVPYSAHELNVEPESTLFLYTDGVTEAQNVSEELYGNDRLLRMLEGCDTHASPEAMCKALRKEVLAFMGEAPQFDDATMLCVRFAAPQVMHTDASEDSLAEVAAFVEDSLRVADVPLHVVDVINVVVDEIYSNIVHYSGASEAEVECYAQAGRVSLFFTDDGKPYNPLDHKDPDVTKPAEEREIGGLGIFIARKATDRMVYSYEDGRNMLFIAKDY